MKKCDNCKRKLPLWLFSKNPKKYQNKTNKGRNYVCNVCNYKLWTLHKYFYKWNSQTDKYDRVDFPNKLSVIKYILFNRHEKSN